MSPSRELTKNDAAIVKALLAKGIWQHDVASLLGCNPGRIADISTGKTFSSIPPANLTNPATQMQFLHLLSEHMLRLGTLIKTAL